MEHLSRRSFLAYTSAAVAAAGVAVALPTAAGAHDAAETAGVGTGLDPMPTSAEPLVAHVRNAKTGEISLFTGDRLVTVHDRKLAALLVRASK